MAAKGRASLYLRGAMIFLAMLLPMLSLLPLGWLWLWERGWALYWIASAFALSIIAYTAQAIALRRTLRQTPEPIAADDEKVAPDPSWTAREQAAWTAVEAIASNVKPSELTDRDRFLNLGLRTIEAVARQIHPGDNNPLWKFTLPEALALVERVSADLRPFVVENIPLGDQLTIGQILKIYGWRSAIGMAEKAYDLWRLVRLVNPVTAAAQEAREQITKHLYANVRDQLARQLARAYVREVGRAAIDLYGGRLRVSEAQLATHVSASTLRDRGQATGLAEPVRILVAGQAGSGKSSVVNALTKEVRAVVDAPGGTRDYQGYEVELEGLSGAMVIDSPRIGASTKEQRAFATRAGDSDLVIWALSANRDDARVDLAALSAIRTHFASRPHRREPTVIVALTHIDKVTQHAPGRNETIDLQDPAIVETVREVAEGLGVPKNDVVPVSFAPGRPPFNIEQLSMRVAARVPDARQAQLLRLMEDAAPRWSVRRVLGQAGNAVKSAAKSVVPSVFRR
ncbi:GTPase [Hyphomicrobium sp. NDB2Meth4]|uniref:GTPase family protein n=1 Tax=Hyphomicrobium sp. NDB2Meth4 TaxID=1892846 RepID=UPI000A45C66D|nr:GTPase [Hyphomicrobium sp. NDB2Meth4]